MEYTNVEVKSNFGYDKVKMRIISYEKLSDYQIRYISSLRRDEAIKYGNAMKWKVIDIDDEL